MPTITPGVSQPRAQLCATALGYVSETSRLAGVSSAVTLAAQALRGTALGLKAGDVVSNIIVCVTTAAAGTAGVVNVGLMDSSYNKLAVSGDVQASFTSTGVKSLALSASYTVTADGLYYPVIDMTTGYGTTQPALSGNTITASSNTALSGKPRVFWLQSGQSSIPNTATPGDTSAGIWFAAN